MPQNLDNIENGWKTKDLFFIDAETDGLYGPFISVAIIVTDWKLKAKDVFYGGIKPENLKIEDEWVRENVLPIMGKYTEYSAETNLLEAVWMLWEKYRENAYAVANVSYPVENRLFSKMVEQDVEDRLLKGPFPLLDISSMLYAKGIDPLKDGDIILGITNSNKHNALEDVRSMIQIFAKLR